MSTEAKPSKSPVIDLSQLKELSGGNEEFIEEMITLFLEDIPSSVEKIKIAYREQNYHVISEQSHKIKPSFGMMGMRNLQEMAASIEQSARATNPENKLANDLDQFLTEILANCEALKKLKAAQ